MDKIRNFSTVSAEYLRAQPDSKRAAMIQERLYKMIDYAKGRYDWYEEQREKRVTMALGMIALSGVAMTVIIGATKPGGIDAKSTAFLASGAVLLTVFLTAFSVFLTYLRGQNLNYTHRKELTTIYSWYHYGVPKDTDVCLLEHLIFGKYSEITKLEALE